MYRGKLWTMRQYAGFSTATESNRRYRYLLERGTTGLSVAFDLPTQIGMDSDDSRARGEVGKVGVAIDSIADMEMLLAEIPLDYTVAHYDPEKSKLAVRVSPTIAGEKGKLDPPKRWHDALSGAQGNENPVTIIVVLVGITPAECDRGIDNHAKAQ